MTKPKRPFVIPFFIPHAGCPHRCIFCEQTSVTGQNRVPFSPDQLKKQVQTFLRFKKPDRSAVQLAFYGGNFLGQKDESIRTMLDTAMFLVQSGKIDSIRFSTRPDTIDAKRLDLIEGYPVKTIEIGVQSMSDHVLKLASRGHTAHDTEKAVSLLKTHRYEIGLQMMIGLPRDHHDTCISSACRIAGLAPDFVRIYPTVVLSGSPLAKLFQKGIYTPLSIEDAVALTKKIYLVFKQHAIPVIRMGLQATPDLDGDVSVLAGPYHPAFGHMVLSAIFLDRATALLASRKGLRTATFIINPRSLSRFQGIGKRNISVLKEQFALESIRICPDDRVATDDLHLCG